VGFGVASEPAGEDAFERLTLLVGPHSSRYSTYVHGERGSSSLYRNARATGSPATSTPSTTPVWITHERTPMQIPWVERPPIRQLI